MPHLRETFSGLIAVLGLVLGLLAVPGRAEEIRPEGETGGLDGHKLTVKSYIDFGQLVNGYNPYAQAGLNPNITMLPLNRVNVMAIQDLVMGKFDISVGLSGLIWWPYGGGTTDIGEKIMSVKPLIPVARARWQFGDAAATSGSVLLGTFNYKYNPDAKNLGEYLYRAGTYPGYLWTTEGWLLMNRAGNYSHGALLTVSQLGGKLKHNLSMFMETSFAPIGAFSPGYDVQATSKFFEAGAGVVLNHFADFKPSQETPNSLQNTYVDVTNANGTHYIGIQQADTSTAPTDTTILHRWSFQGVKVMGRAALNLGSLIPEEHRGAEDLRLFAEVAVLGWKNQPVFYTKRSERIPIMFGMTLPTAKLLDLLTIQGEYYKSPYNDIDLLNSSSLPIPSTANTDSVHADDFKWSVYAKKAINKQVNVYAQAASDHLRLTDGRFRASNIPLTHTWKDWYYVFRLEFNLR